MFSAVFLLLVCFTGSARNFSNNEFTDDENRQYIKEEGVSVVDNRNSIDILPGIYPTYTAIPKTGFSCKEKLTWHYYADTEADCQVFHICETQFSKISFLCPVGSVFNQKYLICDWFYNFDCSTIESFYPSGNDFNEQDVLGDVEKAGDGIGFDLNQSSLGEIITPANDDKIRKVSSRSNRLNAPLSFQRSQSA